MIANQTCDGLRDFFVAWNSGTVTSRRIEVDLMPTTLLSEMTADRTNLSQEFIVMHIRKPLVVARVFRQLELN